MTASLSSSTSAPTAFRSAAVTGVPSGAQGHDQAREAGAQIGFVLGEAEQRHDLGGRRDVEAGLARHAFAGAAEADHDLAQSAVVQVDDAAPEDPARVDAERVALLQVVVDQRGEQVVRRGDGVKVAGEVQVDVAGRHDDRLAAAGRAALQTEGRPERRFAQRQATLSPFLAMPCARPIEIVVLPSPAEVGVSAVTRMTLPGARRASAASRAARRILALSSP